MAVSSDRVRLADGINRSREAAALLTGAVASASQLRDTEVRQLALGALESVSRLQARLQLLGEAYRIAERHLADTPRPVAAATAVGPPGTTPTPAAAAGYFLDGS